MKITVPRAANSFSTRLSLYITITVEVIFIIAFCVVFLFSRQLIRKEATENARRSLSETVIKIEKVLNSVEVAVNNMDWTNYRESGIIKAKQLGTDDYDYHNMEWCTMPKKLKLSYLSEPYYDRGGGEMVMSTYSKPLYDTDGDLIAVFTADLSLEWLTDMVNATRPYPPHIT